jgi:hypothetical protein
MTHWGHSSQVLPIKKHMMRERSLCTPLPGPEVEASGTTTTSSSADREAVVSFTTFTSSSRFHGLSPLEAETTMNVEERRIHERHAKDDNVMSGDDRTLMMLYK